MGYYVPNPFTFIVNADGFSLGAGVTPRTITLTGGNLTLTCSGALTHTFPSTAQVLVGRTSSDVLTNKTLTAPILSAGSITAGTAPIKLTVGTNLSTPEIGAVEYDGSKLYQSDATGTNARMEIHRGRSCYMASDFTTSSLTVVAVTGLALAIPASQIWAFDYRLITNSDSGAGIKLALDVPGSPTWWRAGADGSGGSPNAYHAEHITADNTLGGAVNAYIGDGFLHVAGAISNVTAGNLQIGIAKVTSGGLTVYRGSYGTAWRVG